MLAIDTSALIKRYVDEPGRDMTVRLMETETTWSASHIVRTEAQIAFCRLFGDDETVTGVMSDLDRDLARFVLVPVDELCLERAAQIGCSAGVRTLDAIHLAAAERLPRPVRFLTFDHRQREAAASLGFEVV
ncbi:MAG: type II toxin-antitoxin system VapC family toxin [Acidimicrobiia bacterium]|nr:type II toxin-antitoxin system VapC family toxin [Acidimicrobiia bacterium]